ncbi:MAG: hypothetical protein ABIG30_01110 [Candidatus Aenigmatarchaeota archaeon]
MEEEIGKIMHFYNKIGVAAIELTGELKVGDTLHVKSDSTDFTFTVESMQIEHESVTEAGAGDQVGIRVPETVHENDKLFKVVE